MGASAVQVTQSMGFILGALALFGSLVQKDSLSHRVWTYANIRRGVQYTRDFFASLSRCGSATRPSRRLWASDWLHMPTKHRNITRRVYLLLLHCLVCEHFITTLISHSPLFTDPAHFKIYSFSPLNQVRNYCEIYFRIMHRIPFIELF
jgi:hypothetical protein